MNRLLRRLRIRRNDDGVALITVVLVMALVSALTLTICVIATNNLVSARLAQQAGAAVNASDAGVAQAVTYLRRNGVRDINKCWNTTVQPAQPITPCTIPWARQTNPETVNVGGKAAQSYSVWIEPLAAFPKNKPGRYRITSTGVAGGPAGRTVTVDVEVSTLPFVYGVVAGAVSGGGNGEVHHESIFSTGCVSGRDKLQFDGIDIAFNIPAAVHTSGVITTTNGNGNGNNNTCSSNYIHSNSVKCNTTYPYDQDSRGGPVASTSSCYNATYNYTDTSFIDATGLADKYKVLRPPFSQAQLDQLKAIAKSENTYYTSATGFTVPSGPDSLMYFDLTGAPVSNGNGNNPRVLDLNDLAVSPWNRAPNPGTCPQQSLMVIVEGGNARINSNSFLAAAVFLVSDSPYGDVLKANGTATFTGSLYANNVDLTGNANLWMDQCFMDNPPPALTTARTSNYREVDR